jgi:hypothetical protein
MIEFYRKHGLIEITISFETWRITEWFYIKIMNPLCLLFHKDLYFIDCGYCWRTKGQLICLSQSSIEMKKPCNKCVFDKDVTP